MSPANAWKKGTFHAKDNSHNHIYSTISFALCSSLSVCHIGLS